MQRAPRDMCKICLPRQSCDQYCGPYYLWYAKSSIQCCDCADGCCWRHFHYLWISRIIVYYQKNSVSYQTQEIFINHLVWEEEVISGCFLGLASWQQTWHCCAFWAICFDNPGHQTEDFALIRHLSIPWWPSCIVSFCRVHGTTIQLLYSNKSLHTVKDALASQ